MTLTELTHQPITRKGEGHGAVGFHIRSSDKDSAARGNLRDRYRASSREEAEEPETENDVAFALVTRAASTIDMLQNRCAQLETDAAELRNRLNTETETAERVIKDWERLATAMKSQLQECETRITGLQERLEAAEARAEAGESRAREAERQASLEGEISSSLREKILMAFGSGLQTHATSEGVVKP